MFRMHTTQRTWHGHTSMGESCVKVVTLQNIVLDGLLLLAQVGGAHSTKRWIPGCKPTRPSAERYRL